MPPQVVQTDPLLNSSDLLFRLVCAMYPAAEGISLRARHRVTMIEQRR